MSFEPSTLEASTAWELKVTVFGTDHLELVGTWKLLELAGQKSQEPLGSIGLPFPPSVANVVAGTYTRSGQQTTRLYEVGVVLL